MLSHAKQSLLKFLKVPVLQRDYEGDRQLNTKPQFQASSPVLPFLVCETLDKYLTCLLLHFLL